MAVNLSYQIVCPSPNRAFQYCQELPPDKIKYCLEETSDSDLNQRGESGL